MSASAPPLPADQDPSGGGDAATAASAGAAAAEVPAASGSALGRGAPLAKVLLEVAATVLSRPAMAPQVAAGLSAEALLDRDPSAMVRLLADSAGLRARVRTRTLLRPPEVVPDVPEQVVPLGAEQALGLAAALLSDEFAAAAVDAVLRHLEAYSVPAVTAPPPAAGQPGADVVAGPVPAASAAPAASPSPADADASGADAAGRRRKDRPDAADKQLRYAQRRVAEARTQVERLRGGLENARVERDAALARASAAESDLADAQAQLEAARGDAAAARRQAADVLSAAAVLLEAAQPPPVVVSDDPRVAEQALLAGTAARVESDAPVDGRLAAALAAARLEPKALRTMLTALLDPPAPQVVAPALARQREFAVTPLGGGAEIGGSCMLVEVGDVRILVDAGMRPKKKMGEAGPPLIEQAHQGRIDAIVITHAHNDHAGYVPAVVARQPDVPVYTTSGTAALLGTMWADSITVFGHQSRDDAARAAASPQSRYNGGVGLPELAESRPPYTTEQWRHARSRVVELEVGRQVRLRTGVSLELFPAGHVLGACGVVIAADDRKVTVTGDVSDLAQSSVAGLVVPDAAVGSDLLVIESTYCRRPDGHTRAHAVEAFISTVRETVDAGGRVLVPAFALGRAQEVALLMRERLSDIPVLIDGMARAVSDIYAEQTAGTDRPLFIFGDNVERVRNERRDATIASFRRGVVVTTSGMLSAGPAVPWARSILPDPSSALLIAGYQDEESPGAELLRLSEDTSGAVRQFSLDGRPVTVGARVSKFALSAHADRAGLTSIIDRVAPVQTMLVHGYPGPQREYRAVLTARGTPSVDTGVWASA